MVQRNSLSLYHFHVVYDTVNFTAYANVTRYIDLTESRQRIIYNFDVRCPDL